MLFEVKYKDTVDLGMFRGNAVSLVDLQNKTAFPLPKVHPHFAGHDNSAIENTDARFKSINRSIFSELLPANSHLAKCESYTHKACVGIPKPLLNILFSHIIYVIIGLFRE